MVTEKGREANEEKTKIKIEKTKRERVKEDGKREWEKRQTIYCCSAGDK